MIEVHLYGMLRKIISGSRANEDTILRVELKENEELQQFIQRFGLHVSDMGDCFINGRLANHTDLIKDGDRVGLFPFNMRLIDGGMELKYSPHKR